MSERISGGVAHALPKDMRHALAGSAKALLAWDSLTPLARNEWICWTISVKTPETRAKHIGRVVSGLREGKRRPCCWMGCTHRKDKAPSSSQKFVLAKKKAKR